ncbi:MAG: antibiotic biosynthesis monooxygenase [Candidatus Latescibacteria bacterium]|jgi:(4S)-4-hydroxy-5-phosphonooxypentane-2,3-dione isomerase|nr:antibiotic biosynthesis monooxygenase [Candidatus Latescibacterota bacterium]
MIVYCVNLYVKKEHIDDFIAATAENHKGAISEKGNLRFDVLQRGDNPSQFLLYEVYESEEAVAEHKTTPHYLAWREKVAGWMSKPREGILHTVVCPQDRSLW